MNQSTTYCVFFTATNGAAECTGFLASLLGLENVPDVLSVYDKKLFLSNLYWSNLIKLF